MFMICNFTHVYVYKFTMAYINTSSVNRAVLQNDISKLNSLIKAGARIDIQDNLGYTPLHNAAKKSFTGCVDLLLQHPECSVNDQCFEGCTSLYLACARKNPSLTLIQKLLEKGASVDIANYERIYPLHVACQNGQLSVVKILLDFCADVNVQDIDNDTPLHYAVVYNGKSVVEYLLSKNADTSLGNSYGLNPLMLCIVRGYEDIFNLLLPATVDIYQKGKMSETALSLAIRVGNFHMVQSIINKGYNIDDSIFVLDELYELNNLEIFKLIWSKLDHKLNQNYSFIGEKLQFLEHFEHLKIVFQRDLNLKLGNVFGNLFFIFDGDNIDNPSTEYFTDKMADFEFIIKSIFKYGGFIDSVGFKRLCIFIKNCPYKEHLMALVLSKGSFVITEDLVLFGFTLNTEVGCLCLQYTSHLFNPTNFIGLLIHDNAQEICRKFFSYHSPDFNFAQQMLRSDIKCLRDTFKPLVGKVKSLVELSRNVTREYIGKNMEKNHEVNVIEFRNAIKQLDCPNVIHNILLIKNPVNL